MVSKVSIHRNIGFSITICLIERALPFIAPWHPRVILFVHADTERKLGCIKYRNRVDYVCFVCINYVTQHYSAVKDGRLGWRRRVVLWYTSPDRQC